jgi:hypothetical protein
MKNVLLIFPSLLRWSRIRWIRNFVIRNFTTKNSFVFRVIVIFFTKFHRNFADVYRENITKILQGGLDPGHTPNQIGKTKKCK